MVERSQDGERVRGTARPLDPRLASALEAQNARYAESPAREAHLRALRAGAAAVVTGQQTGLFLGPLYTIYKTASAIRLAAAWAEQSGAPVVPVFWLQTEDHDAAEIAVCHIARGNAQPLTLSLPVLDDGVPVAHRVLPDEVTGALAALDEALAGRPHREEHVALLSRHYRPGTSWGHAFAGVLAELFAAEGLVLLDPRDPALAPLAEPIHRRAFEDAVPLARALKERVHALEAAGGRAPVHVRDDAPLSFFHPQGPVGPRCRLLTTADGFSEATSGRAHTLDALLGILERSPASFSTSALLRPILQDTWLPTAAYIGGPAEVAYFEQMDPLYAAFGLDKPRIVKRAQIRLVESGTRKALARRGLTAEQACRPFDDVMKQVTKTEDAGGDAVADRLIAQVEGALAELGSAMAPGGERGTRALEKTRASMARSARKLGRSLDRAVQLRDRDAIEDVRRIQARLLPGGIPQERFFALPSFAARYGQRELLTKIVEAADPLAGGFRDLSL